MGDYDFDFNKPGFIGGVYGAPEYSAMSGYGGLDAVNSNNQGMMPGMTKNSPSYGSASSMNYTAPGLNKTGGSWKNASGQQKLGMIGEGVSAFGTLAQLYLGFKAMGAQKEQFKFQKGAWEKNFAASLKAYDNQVLDNYNKYAQGNQYFGNAYDDKETYTAARSLSA